MRIGTCELCRVHGVELHDVCELNAWPVELACGPCMVDLLEEEVVRLMRRSVREKAGQDAHR